MALSKIFIIWDDIDHIHMFSIFFRGHGYEADGALSLSEGLEACLQNPPDLLLIERTISEYDDGLEFCRHIRTMPALAHIPIVLGHADMGKAVNLEGEEIYQQVFGAGANALFGRIFDISWVLEHVKILLANPETTNLIERPLDRRPWRRKKES